MNCKIFTGVLMLAYVPCSAQSEKKEGYVEVEALIEQWVKTEGLISKESSEWEAKKEHFAQLKTVFTEQVKLLDEELDATHFTESDFEKKTTEFKKSIERSESARKATIKFVESTTPRVKNLAKYFPLPLVQQLEVDIEVLDQEVKNENVRDLLNAIIKILQSADQYNRRFNVNEEDLVFDGESYRAKLIYLGLSCAFFKAGDKYGMGEPAEGGWKFSLKPEFSKQIKKGFAVYEKQVPSSLFELPLKVKEVQP